MKSSIPIRLSLRVVSKFFGAGILIPALFFLCVNKKAPEQTDVCSGAACFDFLCQKFLRQKTSSGGGVGLAVVCVYGHKPDRRQMLSHFSFGSFLFDVLNESVDQYEVWVLVRLVQRFAVDVATTVDG